MPSGDIPVLSEVFGSTPDVIHWQDILLGDQQKLALGANQAAFPDITKLGNQYYDYMIGLLNRSIPGFSDILSMGGDLTKKMQSISGEELAGQIPQDVVDNVMRSSAFQGLMSGSMGGPMATANAARNYGLTSLDMIQKGVGMQEAAGNAAQRWANMASALNMNPEKFFITPEQQFEASTMNQIQRNKALQLEENLRAGPSPVAKGVSDTIINLLGQYLGSLGGGGGKGGQTAPTFSPMASAGWNSNIDQGTGFGTDFGGGGGGGGVPANMGQLSPFGLPSQASSYPMDLTSSAPINMFSSYNPGTPAPFGGWGGSMSLLSPSSIYSPPPYQASTPGGMLWSGNIGNMGWGG